MMTETEMALYLNENHSAHFTKILNGKPVTKKVTPYDVKRWIGQNRIHELTESGIDDAIRTKRIPPKRGRPARYTQAAKDDIIAACEIMSRGQVAKKFGCDPSYVSLVVRGLR